MLAAPWQLTAGLVSVPLGLEDGANSISCTPDMMEKLASIPIQPSLQQRLQNSHLLAQGQENHTLMEWLTATMWTVLNKARELQSMLVNGKHMLN